MKWIGLTGGIATGKSTVTQMLRARGIAVIDADKIAHQALVASSPVLSQITSAFGGDILDSQGNVQRHLLGQKIFNNKKLREKLESIIHPYVRKEVQALRSELEKKGLQLAVYDIPLLFEKKMQAEFDQVVVVGCDPKTQKSRLMKRNSLSETEAEQRIGAQLSIADKMKEADFVLENNGSLADLEKQVEQLLLKLN